MSEQSVREQWGQVKFNADYLDVELPEDWSIGEVIHWMSQFEPSSIKDIVLDAIAEGRMQPFRERAFYHKQPIPKDLRRAILERDGHRCQYCGATEKLQVDHIIPESKGGSQDSTNLQILCKPCNVRKHNRVDQ